MDQEVQQPENKFCSCFHSVSRTGIFMLILTQMLCKNNFINYSITRKRHVYVTLQQFQNSDQVISINKVDAKLIYKIETVKNIHFYLLRLINYVS